MAAWTTLGPGTVTVLAGTGGTATDFSGEVLSATVKHEYEEVGETRTMLDGSKRGASQVRTDGIGLSIENDLTAAGLYKFLMDNDGESATVTYTPSTEDGAQWTITGVVLRLPDEVGADEFGSPLASEVEWTGGVAAFTPAT